MEHKDSAAFMDMTGTAVALAEGTAIMAFERRGTVLGIFDINLAEETLYAFVQAYRGQRIYPDKKHLLMREYPKTAAALLERAGFYKDILDYILYR